jgi:hypothetical protein
MTADNDVKARLEELAGDCHLAEDADTCSDALAMINALEAEIAKLKSGAGTTREPAIVGRSQPASMGVGQPSVESQLRQLCYEMDLGNWRGNMVKESDARALINAQEAEIERLKDDLDAEFESNRVKWDRIAQQNKVIIDKEAEIARLKGDIDRYCDLPTLYRENESLRAELAAAKEQIAALLAIDSISGSSTRATIID